MDTWKAFEANELTHSAAHHLLAIHEVGADYGGWARVSDIARQLDITRGSVSINLRALKKRGWVKSDDHHMVALSSKGLKAVEAIMAKRTVVKAFLTTVLGAPEDQSEIDSCKIEHLISDATAHRLVQFMRFVGSAQSVAGEFLARFRRFEGACDDSDHCEICHGRCLAEGLNRAVR